MRMLFCRFMRDEDGATAIEYALVSMLVSVALIANFRNISTSLNTIFTQFSAGFK